MADSISYLKGRIKIYKNEPQNRWKIICPDLKFTKFRTNLKDAKKLAEKLKTELQSGHTDLTVLNPTQKRDYNACLTLLRKTKTDLFTAVKEYCECYKILKGNHHMEAARSFAKKNVQSLPVKSVKSAVPEFIESINYPHYRKLCASHLIPFADSFNMNLKDVQAIDIENYLNSLPHAERTKKNKRDAISALYKFAKKRGWILKDDETIENVRKYRSPDGPISILTPAELIEIFKHANFRLMTWIAFRAFSTIRNSELSTLDWKQVKEDNIRMEDGKGRTPKKRIIPIVPNLAAWIGGARKKSGPICELKDPQKSFKRVCKKAGVAYSRNALRHSVISYRVMETGNSERTALESGNSVAKIHSNYLELVTKEEAAEWFSIMPEDF